MDNFKTSKPVISCQICGSSKLESVLFLGYIPPVNTMPDIDSIPEEQSAYPLELLRCPECTLVQIGLEVNPEVLFPFSYPYLSGSTKILRENFADLYSESSTILNLVSNDLIIDIGSNDGTLLSNYHKKGHKVLGIEPSQAGVKAREKNIETLTAYFGIETAKVVREKYGTAKIITAANVFAHIGDIDSVVMGITDLLNEDGVFISESHYLLSLIQTLQYDTIYHEHLRYYSLESISFLLNKHGLEVFSAKKIPTHGGSIRVYAGRKGKFEIHNSVSKILEEEKSDGITNGSGLKTFKKNVVKSKLDLYSILSKIKKNGSKIYGISAPSRASTLINYTGIDDSIIDCVMEISTSHKIGKYVPGTRIPVLDETKLFEDQPEYALLLSWHISKDLIGILRKRGFKGKFITPLPVPKILDA